MSEAGEGRLNIAWIGHSTVLLRLDGVRLLTDPLLRPRIAHLRRVGAPQEAGVADVDAVLISHVHHDHLDLRSLDRVRATPAVVPLGARQLLERRCVDPVGRPGGRGAAAAPAARGGPYPLGGLQPARNDARPGRATRAGGAVLPVCGRARAGGRGSRARARRAPRGGSVLKKPWFKRGLLIAVA